MYGDPAQLSALLAVVTEGSFEGAADVLGVSPSAVSQRIKALESRIGQVVVQRTRPCRATPTGEVLLRHARQLELLEAETRAALEPHGRTPTLPVAINADSLATWGRDLLRLVAEAGDVALELRVEDQGHSAELLRAGRVLAAVTADPVAVQGCSVEPLPAARYVPVAAIGLWERHGRSLSGLPMVTFNDKDRLQHDVLRRLGLADPPLVHQVPSTEDFAQAVRLGLGWGALPVQQLGRGPDALADQGLVAVAPGHDVRVPLHWQRWRIDSPVLDRLSGWVRSAAAAPPR